jgi:hypothetical protein
VCAYPISNRRHILPLSMLYAVCCKCYAIYLYIYILNPPLSVQQKPLPIWAMIETAKGVLNASAIARSSAVECLVFGSNDLTKDICAKHTPDRLPLVRITIIDTIIHNYTHIYRIHTLTPPIYSYTAVRHVAHYTGCTGGGEIGVRRGAYRIKGSRRPAEQLHPRTKSGF